MVATLDCRRSVAVSINVQITNKSKGDQHKAFTRLREIEEHAVRVALG